MGYSFFWCKEGGAYKAPPSMVPEGGAYKALPSMVPVESGAL